MPAGKKEEFSSMSEYTTCRVQNSLLIDTSVLQFKDHMTVIHKKKFHFCHGIFNLQSKIKLNSVYLLFLFSPPCLFPYFLVQ